MKYLNVASNVPEPLLVLADTPIPLLLPEQVLIKVAAIGVNRADILQKQGKYPAPKGESDILGIEVCGEIVQLGDKVTHWQLGDIVFSIVSGGGYAEFVAVNAEHLIAKPKTFSLIEAAASAEVFLTAYQALFTIAGLNNRLLTHTENAPSILIHAGASGVGCAAIQLAKAVGCKVVTTVSTDEKKQACYTLGADYVINYHHEDFVQWSKQHIPLGFDVIIDVVAGEYLNKNIQITALDGHIVILSILGGRYSQAIDVAKMLQKRINLSATTLRNRSDDYKTQLVKNFQQQFYSVLKNRDIVPLIDRVYPWHDVNIAHQRMEKNENIGKLVLFIEE